MRRVLVVTWALGTASGVLLGLFGVQLVSSRFSTSRVSPLSHPEVLRALQAARSVPAAAGNEVAAAPTPDTTSPTSPPTDAAPARPSAEAMSTPAPTSPASSLPRPGTTAGPLVGTAAVPSSTTTTVAPVPPPTSTTATTVKTSSDDKDSKKSKSSTTTTTRKATTTTTTSKAATSSRTQSRSLKSRGGVVVVSWRSDGTVRIDSARPEAGYQMKIWSSGPDKVVVTFVNEREKRGSLVEATKEGPSSAKVTEYRCSGRWGTSSWNCQEV